MPAVQKYLKTAKREFRFSIKLEIWRIFPQEASDLEAVVALFVKAKQLKACNLASLLFTAASIFCRQSICLAARIFINQPATTDPVSQGRGQWQPLAGKKVIKLAF